MRAVSIWAAVLAIAMWGAVARAQCGGICSYEVGSSHLGSAYAGASAAIRDASTAYLNPAGLSSLPSDQFVVGGIGVISNRRFSPSEGSAPVGLDGGGSLADPLGSYGVYSSIEITDRASFGLAMNFPYGGNLEYADTFVGRSYTTDIFFVGTNIQPALAYEIGYGLSFGAALNILNFRLDQDLVSGLVGQEVPTSIRRADDWSVGFTLGLLMEQRWWSERLTRLAFVYRNGFDVELRGTSETIFPGAQQPLAATFLAGFDLPRGINVGLFQELTPDAAVFADVGWSDWSAYSGQTAFVGERQVTRAKNMPTRDWRDTVRIGIGGEYRVFERLLGDADALCLETGFSWDSSPVKSYNRLPDVPIGNTFRVAAGLRYAVMPWLDAAFGYTFLSLDEARVANVELPTAGGMNTTSIDGKYGPNHANMLGLTFTGKFTLSLSGTG